MDPDPYLPRLTARLADGLARLPADVRRPPAAYPRAALCYQLLVRPLTRAADVARIVLSRRRDDGGFVEVAPMRRSGTNPTAAGVGLLQLIQPEVDALSAEIRADAVDFLAEMAGDD